MAGSPGGLSGTQPGRHSGYPVLSDWVAGVLAMRLASVNLNKRLGNLAACARLTAWLEQQRVDVLVAQEPWKAATVGPSRSRGFRRSAGDSRLCAWIAES
jgi:hypothetical protein